MGSFRTLLAYQKGFSLAMDIFHLTKKIPKAESLSDQITRSSRSVCSNIGEAYKKRNYPKHFSSKLSDAATENSETQVWLDFALACGYINTETYHKLDERCEEVAKLLHYMIQHPQNFA